MKNYYIAPAIRNVACESEEMIAVSTEKFLSTEDSQNVILNHEEFNESFSSRGLWSEENED